MHLTNLYIPVSTNSAMIKNISITSESSPYPFLANPHPSSPNPGYRLQPTCFLTLTGRFVFSGVSCKQNHTVFVCVCCVYLCLCVCLIFAQYNIFELHLYCVCQQFIPFFIAEQYPIYIHKSVFIHLSVDICFSSSLGLCKAAINIHVLAVV